MTLQLALAALLVAVLIALPLGIAAALRPGSLADVPASRSRHSRPRCRPSAWARC